MHVARQILEAKSDASVLLISGMSASDLNLDVPGNARLKIMTKPLNLDELCAHLGAIAQPTP